MVMMMMMGMERESYSWLFRWYAELVPVIEKNTVYTRRLLKAIREITHSLALTLTPDFLFFSPLIAHHFDILLLSPKKQ